MLSVTVEQVLLWEPCEEYTRKRIEELFAGRETVNVDDVLEMDIPDVDTLWAVLREDLVPAKTLHEYACRIAEQILMREREAGREPDARSWKAIEVKRKWLKGAATDTELEAAAWAAWTVVEAARVAAGKAAGVAAWAAREAAGVAARVAAGAAARVAAGAAAAAVWAGVRAAGAAEAEQIKILKELLEQKARGEWVKRYEMASKKRYIEPDEWFMEERMDGRWVKWDDFES